MTSHTKHSRRISQSSRVYTLPVVREVPTVPGAALGAANLW